MAVGCTLHCWFWSFRGVPSSPANSRSYSQLLPISREACLEEETARMPTLTGMETLCWRLGFGSLSFVSA